MGQHIAASRVLIISEGPPPLGDTVAEGGALRAWGLAKGLAHHGHTVTFAYRSTFKLADNKSRTKIPEHISIAVWNPLVIDTLLEDHKIVIMRYAMGEAEIITTKLSSEHILVSDSYIPISVEVSARKSDDLDEQLNYLRLQHSSMVATRRADYILYASPQQRNYYIGYLAGINKLNPTTYDDLQARMFEVPYGVDPGDKPKKTAPPPKNPTLLWYGAFYSWFDMSVLVKSLLRMKEKNPEFKLLIAGAKNPYNQDKGLLAHYKKTVDQLEILGDAVEYIPWSAFDQRFSIYEKASAIISYNHTGLENNFAWRTRLMDFLLADRPILTNGGDPLGDDLIRRQIAYRVDPQSLDKVFHDAVEKPPKVKDFEEAVERYSWQVITEDLAKELATPTRMRTAQMDIKLNFWQRTKRAIRGFLLIPLRTSRYIQKNGFKKTMIRIIKGAHNG